MPDQRYNTGSGLAALVSGDVPAIVTEMERLIREHDELPPEQKGDELSGLVVDLEDQVRALRAALGA